MFVRRSLVFRGLMGLLAVGLLAGAGAGTAWAGSSKVAASSALKLKPSPYVKWPDYARPPGPGGLPYDGVAPVLMRPDGLLDNGLMPTSPDAQG